MATTARLNTAMVSAQKCRLVADQIRGLKVEKAIDILTFSPKKSARIMKKVLESAIANAEHNDVPISTNCVSMLSRLVRVPR